MTKKVISTDIAEIKHLKVACGNCGFAVQVPVDRPESCLEACRGCGARMPANAIGQYLRAAQALQNTLGQPDSQFQAVSVVIETEEK